MKNVLRETAASPRTHAVAAEASPRTPGDEIDLLGYGRTLVGYWYVLLAATIAAAGLAYAISKWIPPTYQAEFRLMVTEPRLDAAPPPEVRVASFREVVESPTQAALLLREFRLDGPPYNLTAQRFLENHVDVDVIRDTTIIEVAVRLTDRDLLLKAATRYAEQLVAAGDRLSADSLEFTTGRIGHERDTALRRLKELDAAVHDYRRRAQLEVLQADVDAMLLRRPEALDLTVRIQGERARVQQAEAELARQEPVRSVKRAVEAFPPAPVPTQPEVVRPRARLPEAATSTSDRGRTGDRSSTATRDTADSKRQSPRSGTTGTARGDRSSTVEDPEEESPPRRNVAPPVPRAEEVPGELQIRGELLDPYVNPVYEALQREASAARTRLAGLEQERRELVARLNLDAPSAARLNRLYEAEAGLDALTRDRDVARDAYLNAANKFEEARLQSTIRNQRLVILDAPLPPDRPVAPRPVRNAATAALIALTLAVVAVLAFDASRQRATS